MTLTIDLDDELASRLEKRARSECVPMNQLAHQALASFAAKEINPIPSDEPWTKEKNARRCELIDRQISGATTAGEREELDRFQAELRLHLNRDAPFNLDTARAVHRELTQGGNGRNEDRCCLTPANNIDHFQPQALRADLGTEYDNLLYACARCNLAKGVRTVPDPLVCLTADQVTVAPDGSLVAHSPDAERLIWLLDLDTPEAREWRLIWMRNVELARDHDPDQLRRILGFPDDLPDLRKFHPPGKQTSRRRGDPHGAARLSPIEKT